MKLNSNQIQHLSEKIFNNWKKQNILTLKVDEKKVIQKISDIIRADYERETALEKDVSAMIDQIEKNHSGEFQRHKMFQLLKQKLAKEKKIIL